MAVLDKEYIGVTDARQKLASVIETLQQKITDHVYLMRQNQPVAVILPPDAYRDIQALKDECEHLQDALAIAQAQLVDDGTRYSLDEVLEKHSIAE